MSVSLLSTKLHIPPARSGLVSRARLMESIDAGVKGRLILISAPAGFGKTTLLSEWIGRYGKPVAWLSLEKEDNDPGRFWAYMMASLRTVQPDLGKNTIELQFLSPQSRIDAALTPLINEIAVLTDPMLLVVDDYHVIDSASIQEGMIFLVEHLPDPLHLMIASRSDPAWPLAHWRSRGQLAEIRAADLRFTPQEAADFLNCTMQLNLSARDIAALEERTEGWIAGLQMAALSLQGREDVQGFINAFTGSNRYIFDYLVEEVLGRQPAEVQEFLLQTSILDHLSAPLCDAILGRNNSREILDRLEKTNLFLMPLDDVRQWYRYHHLFADILTTALTQSSPGKVPELNLRACDWYAEHGFLADATVHALNAGDLERLAQLLEQYAFTIMDVNEASYFIQRLDTIPESAINSHPWLNIAKAWLLAYLGRHDGIEQAIREAEKHADPANPRLLGFIAAIRTLTGELFSNYLPDAGIENAHRALELLPPDDFRPRAFVSYHLANLLSWFGDVTAARRALEEASSLSMLTGDTEMQMTAQFELASLLRSQGKLHESLRIYEKTFQLPGSENPDRKLKSLAVGFAYLRKALIYLEWNRLEEALQLAREGLRICKLWGYSDYLYNGWLIYAGILNEIGEYEEALRAVREAKQIYPDSSPFNRINSLEVVIQLAKGDFTRAEDWIKRSNLSPEDLPDFGHRTEYYHFARILLALGRPEEALGILERLLVLAEQVGNINLSLELLTMLAVIHLDLGDREKALSLIRRALGLAEEEGFVRAFLNKGPGMEQLLLAAIPAGIHPDYARELLTKVRERPGAPVLGKPSPGVAASRKMHEAVGEPISERELEVLRLLQGSLNAPEIARELYISVGTVRTHVKNIFRKLDVNRRIEAVRRARELGLI